MAFVKKFFRALKRFFKPRKSRRKKSSSRSSRKRKLLGTRRSRSLAVRKSRRSARRPVRAKKTRSARPAAVAKPKPSIRKTAKAEKLKTALKAKDAARAQSSSAVEAAPKPVAQPGPAVGEITHYFSKIMVCVVKISAPKLTVGERIWIRGSATDFQQKIASMQIQSVDVKVARKGNLVGLKVDKPCRVGDVVHKAAG